MKHVLIVCTLIAAVATSGHAQNADRDSALAMYRRGEQSEAAAIFEKLIAAGTADREVYRQFGWYLISRSAAVADINDRKAQRARARQMFVKAFELGATEINIQEMIRTIPEDGGSDFVFSRNKDVDSAMKRGEALFAKGDVAKARAEYETALRLDPTHYAAAVFIGDTYLREKQVDSSYVWYMRATEMDPNQETAWRYWSDVLLKNKNLEEARTKAIEAVVADPYSRMSITGLTAWQRAARAPMSPPPIDFPAKDGKGSKVALAAYDSVRAAFRGDGRTPSAAFKAAGLYDERYRHSLAEEAAALRAAYKTGAADKSLLFIKELDEAGFLDAYVLYFRADEGIAKDYPAHRTEHRDRLREFWAKYVIGAPFANK